jgi:hypothetical protein
MGTSQHQKQKRYAQVDTSSGNLLGGHLKDGASELMAFLAAIISASPPA